MNAPHIESAGSKSDAGADLKDAINAAVVTATLRTEGAQGEGGTVRTPLPRMALRAGVTGHRPARLQKSADKLGMTLAQHEDWLAERLAQVFVAIENATNHAHRLYPFEAPDGAKLHFYEQSQPPLIRLVCGLALGVDAVALRLVDQRFRGAKPSGEDLAKLRFMRETRRPRTDRNAIEWQIDGVLPFPQVDFALDAAEDYILRYPECTKTDLASGFAGYWRSMFKLPDTMVTLPALWRPGVERDRPSDEVARQIKALRESGEMATFGTPREPPVLPGETARDLALDYNMAGEFMLRQIDVLVAVWDGEPAQGIGGAPDLVAEAIEHGVTVVYIDPDDPVAPPRLVSKVERFERHSDVVGWHPLPRRPDPERADACVDALRDAIVRLTEPPSGAGPHDHNDDRNDRQRLVEFLSEEWPVTAAPTVYRAFQNMLTTDARGRGRAFIKSLFSCGTPIKEKDPHLSEEGWCAFIIDNPDEGVLAVRLKPLLHRRFVMADLLAVRYADLYRGAFIKAYLLAAFAVFIAVCEFVIPHDHAWSLPIQLITVVLELGVIYAIWKIVKDGRDGYWHQRFVHYRSLAESLRHMRFLATFGEYAFAGERRGAEGAAWWLWYLRATARELGLPQAELGPTYQRSLLTAVMAHEVSDQIDYHDRTAKRESRTDEKIHSIGYVLFKVTAFLLVFIGAILVALSVHLLWTRSMHDLRFEELDALLAHYPASVRFALHYLKPLITIAAAALPTLGAALTGIRFTADFDGKAARSFVMKRELEDVAKLIDDAVKRQEFEATRHALRETARVMADDVSAFQSLYGRKALVLPS